MFQGSQTISMDAKGRIAIPKGVREMLMEQSGGKIVVTANPDPNSLERCVWIYTEPRWQEVLPTIEQLPSFNKLAKRTQRILIGYATTLELDGHGRILMPAGLRDYAFLDKKLLLVGQGKKLELWSEERWYKWMDESIDDDQAAAEMMTVSF